MREPQMDPEVIEAADVLGVSATQRLDDGGSRHDPASPRRQAPPSDDRDDEEEEREELDEELDEALDDSFPASDPPSITIPRPDDDRDA